MSNRTRRPPDPRAEAEARGYDTGSHAIPVDVVDVAVGTRATVPQVRRADPLNRVVGATQGMRLAALIYRQAHEHTEAGRGMGPMPWAAERVQEHRRGDGLGVALLAQERAVSAATWCRRGVDAMGMAASQGVVNWVVIRGLPLDAYDSTRKWRKGRARSEIIAALGRLEDAYKCA